MILSVDDGKRPQVSLEEAFVVSNLLPKLLKRLVGTEHSMQDDVTQPLHTGLGGTRPSLFLQREFEALKSLPSDSVDCIWTDPPYFLSNGGISFNKGKVVSVDKGNWDSSRGIERDAAFHWTWIKLCFEKLKAGGTIWVSGTYHSYIPCGYALTRLGFKILNDIVWEKPNPPPNVSKRRFVHASELLLWAAKPSAGKTGHFFNWNAMKRRNGGSPMKSVWRIPTPNRAEKKYGRHPTQKPVDLVERCLIASTQPGDLVLDPFMGSGTTGVAALRLGRRFVGIESNLEYIALAKRRLRYFC